MLGKVILGIHVSVGPRGPRTAALVLTAVVLAVLGLNLSAAEAVSALGNAAGEPKAPSSLDAGGNSPVEDIFRRGLMEEEFNQNPAAAAQAYREVIAALDAQRKMAATAVFRLGECYRKQGQTNEAVAQFERVTRDFSDQSQLVELAQQRVAELAPTRLLAGGGTGAQPLNPEQVQLVRQEIKLIDTQLVEVDRRIQMGRASPEDRIPFQTNLLSLQRQLPENAPSAKQKTLIEQQIKLVESQLELVKKRISMGVAATIEAVPFEREILRLKRDLAGVSPATAEGGPEAAVVTDEEAKEIQRIKAIIRDSPDLINAKGEGGRTPLHNAAEKGQLVVAQFLLDNHAEVNATDQGKFTPLHWAAMKGHKSMVELLLARGANVNANSNGGTPLYLAAQNGYRAVAEVLLANKAQVNPKGLAAAFASGEKFKDITPLHAAVYQGYKSVAELLLDHGADLNARCSSDRRLSGGFLSGTPLHFAVWRGDEALVSLLLARGADVNATDDCGMTPLLSAARSGKLAIAELLLNQKADPNAAVIGTVYDSPVPSGGASSVEGYTPLHYAARDNNLALAELLLRHHANVNAMDHFGQAPLLLATGSDEKRAVVELLLANGADVNERNKNGGTVLSVVVEANATNILKTILAHKPDLEARFEAWHGSGQFTPLQLAVVGGNQSIVAMLLEAGANPNVTDERGRTPLHWTVQNQQMEIAKLLLEHHADPNVADRNGVTPLRIASDQKQGVREGVSFPPRQPPILPTRMIPGPGGAPIPYGVATSRAPAPSPANMIDLLRHYGANENLERLSQIALSRPSLNVFTTIFHKGTNLFNRYTLLELVGQAGNLSFPDFQNVTIHRLTAKGETNDVNVDLESVLKTGDCSKDVGLEWGDAVELPVKDHLVNERWQDYSPETLHALAKCLVHTVYVVIKGQTNQIAVASPILFSGGSWRRGTDAELVRYRGIIQDGEAALVQGEAWLSREPPASQLTIHGRQVATDAPVTLKLTIVGSLRLSEVVRNCGLLLTSSDLTRATVTRTDPQTKAPVELVFNLDKTNPNDDLWLQDGDVIEVPERAD